VFFFFFEISLDLPYYNSATVNLWLDRAAPASSPTHQGRCEFGSPLHDARRGAGQAPVALTLCRRRSLSCAARRDAPGRNRRRGGSKRRILISNF